MSVILNSMLKPAELAFLLQVSDSEMLLLLTERKLSQELASRLPAIPSLRRIIEFDGDSYAEIIANSSCSSPIVGIKGEDETVIGYSSGVLGRQKGVVDTNAFLAGTKLPHKIVILEEMGSAMRRGAKTYC